MRRSVDRAATRAGDHRVPFTVGAYLSLTITELPGAGPAAGCPLGATVRTVWCHLPAGWIVDGALLACRRRVLLDSLRPVTGPAGPDRPLMLTVREQVLSDRQTRDRPWLGDRAQFRRYAPDGSHRRVPPDEL